MLRSLVPMAQAGASDVGFWESKADGRPERRNDAHARMRHRDYPRALLSRVTKSGPWPRYLSCLDNRNCRFIPPKKWQCKWSVIEESIGRPNSLPC